MLVRALVCARSLSDTGAVAGAARLVEPRARTWTRMLEGGGTRKNTHAQGLRVNDTRPVIVVAPVGEACGRVWGTDSVEEVVATVGRLALVYQNAHQVILLAIDVELWLGFNRMAELDVEELVTLLDWLEALVVNDQDL